MRFTYIGLVSFLLVISCKNLEPDTPIVSPKEFDKKAYAIDLKKQREDLKKNSPQTQKEKSISQSDSAQKASPKKLVFKEKTDTVHMKIVYGKAKMDTAKLPLQKMVFVFNSDTANKLKLKITPSDSSANLRIAQIIDSEGNSTGPFEKKIEIPIIKKGMQKVILSENPTQKNPWGGTFQFEVQLGW